MLEYQNQKQNTMYLTKNKLNRALTIMKDQLNSTFLNEVKQEQERFSWFISG